MAIRSLLKRLARALPMAAAGGLLLLALYLVASVEQESSRLGSISLVIFLIAALALVVLVVAIAQRLIRLLRQARAHAPGARLRARLVGVFIALALPPVVVVYLFSVEFLNRTIDQWFDTGAEPALADSIDMAQLFLDLRTREASARLARIADSAPIAADEEALLDFLFSQISSAGPAELTLLDSSGRLQAIAHINPQRMVADLPSAFALAQAGRGQQYAAAEPSGDGLQIRVLLPIELMADPRAGFILQGIFPLPAHFSELAARIEQAYFRYENISFLRQRLQQSFVLILSLVLGITALLAILAAFNAASRLVRPIRELAEATELMREGEFPETLNVSSRDELGFLVESFNSMAQELNRIQRQLESQTDYLQTVLGRLSAGVIAFDGRLRLNAANQSASDILGVDLGACHGRDLNRLTSRFPELHGLFEVVERRIEGGGDAWREEIKLERADQTLALVCRGSTLPGDSGGHRGHVVVFDDVTMLDQAQRQAAWAELAQRLAHEVKNPLTPIRLAAERLQMRLTGQLDADDAELLDRATRTIINQVDALHRLVDAFGDYARPGKTRREPLDIHGLIADTVELWTAGDSGITFDVALEHGDIQPLGDSGQFQQILNNLIQNAREAHLRGRPGITIRSQRRRGDAVDWLCIEIGDDGPGFSAAILPRAFEPYATTKTRGTGLGLAIVDRIVDRMGGRIEAENSAAGGALVRLLLPLEIHSSRSNAVFFEI